MRSFTTFLVFFCTTHALKCYSRGTYVSDKYVPKPSDAVDCSVVAQNSYTKATQCFTLYYNHNMGLGCSFGDNPCERYGIANGECKPILQGRGCCCGTDLCNSNSGPKEFTKSPAAPTNFPPTLEPQPSVFPTTEVAPPEASTKSANSMFFYVICILLSIMFQ